MSSLLPADPCVISTLGALREVKCTEQHSLTRLSATHTPGPPAARAEGRTVSLAPKRQLYTPLGARGPRRSLSEVHYTHQYLTY